MKNNSLLIIAFFVLVGVHFPIYRASVGCCENVFFRYYLFLTLVFMFVVTMMSLFKKLYPQYLGFVFMGLVMVKLSLMFILMDRLGIKDIPNYKFHFIIPYLVSLALVTLYSVNLLQKDEKNH